MVGGRMFAFVNMRVDTLEVNVWDEISLSAKFPQTEARHPPKLNQN
jgi:hypothetical protein